MSGLLEVFVSVGIEKVNILTTDLKLSHIPRELKPSSRGKGSMKNTKRKLDSEVPGPRSPLQ